MDRIETYNKLICALTHDLSVCERCKKCKGKDFSEIRLNLVKDLAYSLGMQVPWDEFNRGEK